jgi:hypothetical protein
MLRRNYLILILGLLLMLAAAAPAFAGGWVTIELDELPTGELRPNRPIRVGFTVLQHGKTPVHTANIMNDQPLLPVLVAVNQETAESATAVASPDAKTGHFTVEFTLPSAGTWSWSLIAPPFEGTSTFEPLVVTGPASAPAAAAPPAESDKVVPSTATTVTGATPAALVLLGVVVVVALMLLAIRRPPVPAEKG